uniref:ATP synthase F0 subunit 8 n=1 Tax=Setaria digitata TaxID=48799 RepID=A0A915PN78_9BILA
MKSTTAGQRVGPWPKLIDWFYLYLVMSYLYKFFKLRKPKEPEPEAREEGRI